MVTQMKNELTKVYRLRVWKNKTTQEYEHDDDVYENEVPSEFLSLFKETSDQGKVFTVLADGDAIDEASGNILLILSEDKMAISNYVRGFLLGLRFDIDGLSSGSGTRSTKPG